MPCTRFGSWDLVQFGPVWRQTCRARRRRVPPLLPKCWSPFPGLTRPVRGTAATVASRDFSARGRAHVRNGHDTGGIYSFMNGASGVRVSGRRVPVGPSTSPDDPRDSDYRVSATRGSGRHGSIRWNLKAGDGAAIWCRLTSLPGSCSSARRTTRMRIVARCREGMRISLPATPGGLALNARRDRLPTKIRSGAVTGFSDDWSDFIKDLVTFDT
jgi:hypothetical protein